MDDYSDRQRRRDAEYLKAWQKLPARERKRLAKAGIVGPDVPVYRTGKQEVEATLERAATPEDTAFPDDCGEESHDDVAAALRRVFSELIASERTLDLECVAFVLRLGYDGASMTDIAKRYGVTRAAVSKKILRYSEAMGVGQVAGQRSLTARVAYARRASTVHSRHEVDPDRH
jgi:hypothetical protein